ncbi:TetR/AcrR family transcriptional regulator [Phaeacidiphilus oryzae]|uniref:TetR/AcrR family transcriptional regulator n=1 Tax=Phaeacidiphilus oryzae TaxID=348818 RepID=UPI00056CF960|nr:TetR/AcrR family transcriptional regulator [Phaeacidiphilus oryzae]
MPKVSQEYKDRQRAEILDAARRCFVRNGFHRTSMQDVIAEAGRSTGAVYRYFAGKDDMILAVATENLAEVAGALRAAVRSSGQSGGGGEGGGGSDPARVMTALLEDVASRHADQRLATVALMVWAEALRDPALAERLRSASAQMAGDLADVVREVQAAGGLEGASAEAVALALLAMLPGFLLDLALLEQDGTGSFPDALRVLLPGQPRS